MSVETPAPAPSANTNDTEPELSPDEIRAVGRVVADTTATLAGLSPEARYRVLKATSRIVLDLRPSPLVEFVNRVIPLFEVYAQAFLLAQHAPPHGSPPPDPYVPPAAPPLRTTRAQRTLYQLHEGKHVFFVPIPDNVDFGDGLKEWGNINLPPGSYVTLHEDGTVAEEITVSWNYAKTADTP